ncbi:HNH endonuclease [Clostridium cadaveris]|uniref:HNH endonuclease n=1 Tax=Clostridium cadaveris TaxID=1529 RepID=A0A1I2LZX6_9CLOT|nr:HNH endonuclease domain-containing protein [Clostridium cadaveris]MDM8313157.1 HNH endonuclease domain-containing protein [Clostridium cadaveris]SFF84118.1 HNH endonuclease [Clostridium cadaveris]
MDRLKSEFIREKEILVNTDVPYSRDVDYITFSRVLNDDKVVASYKMYWLLAVLDEVISGNKEITFKKLISRIVASAWYPISAFKLSFGSCDNLAKVVEYIHKEFNLKTNCDKRELIDFIYNCDDKELKKMLNSLTLNVPYRFLSPFFPEKLKGKRNVNKPIVELSAEDKGCIYEICKGFDDEWCIKIRDEWYEYLKNNYKIIQGWTYYKLVCFLQKRNPNVPGIAMKLEAPLNRELKEQTKIWKKIIESRHIEDLYTGLSFSKDNYEKYGVLSMDHFIPWSFVLHDQMWNLVPTFKNINSKKSDNLLSYDKYIEGLAKLQYEAFSFVIDNKRKNEIEEYRTLLRVPDADIFKNSSDFEEFFKRYKDGTCPVYNIAVNQGFYVVKSI